MLSYQQAVRLIREAGYAGHAEPSIDDDAVCLKNGLGVWRVPLTRQGVRAFVADWRSPREAKPTLH